MSEINLAELQASVSAEVAKLSTEDIRKQLEKQLTKKKVQQKKQQGSGSQKAYQKKKQEQFKALKAKALELGIWDEINKTAETAAEAELTEEAPDAEEETAETTA